MNHLKSKKVKPLCNIVVLKAGVSIPYEKLYNCVNNNYHSYGLILKDVENKKLEVIRQCPKGGNDPKEIYDLLEDNKDVERYLHLRHRTDGPIDLDNTHPFPAYISDTRQVYFMHNGTLADFKPKTSSTYENNIRREVLLENVSDSKKFNDEFLAPFLLTHSGENGKADIHDPMFDLIIKKFWSYSSKGLLICNDLEPAYINKTSWKEMDFGSGKFMSSNDDYWNKLTRGPAFELEKKKKEQEELAERQKRFPNDTSNNRGPVGRHLANLKDVNLRPREVLTEDLSRVFEDFDIWSDAGLASLSNLTQIELQQFVERDKEGATGLLIHLTSNFDELYKRKQRLVHYLRQAKKNGRFTLSAEDEKELSEDV